MDESQRRKSEPVYSGFDAYFPRAKRAAARVSKAGNDKHNPGTPLHWSKDKSTDHPDCASRHQLTPYDVDPDSGELHLVHAFWRLGAWLEVVLEAKELGIATPDQLKAGEIAVSELGPAIVALRRQPTVPEGVVFDAAALAAGRKIFMYEPGPAPKITNTLSAPKVRNHEITQHVPDEQKKTYTYDEIVASWALPPKITK